MAIKLTEAERQEIAARSENEESVIRALFEWYSHYRKSGKEDAIAFELAEWQQTLRFGEVFEAKTKQYLAEVQGDFKRRLLVIKKWDKGKFLTKSGIRVRSKIEKIIADFLFDCGIAFVYEPILDLDGFCVMPDFYLTELGIIIEHFGLSSISYQAASTAKLARYDRFNLRVIATYPEDEPQIEQVLTEKLRKFGVVVPERTL